MSLLAPLLDIQELDLAADGARKRSETLPEREQIPLLAARLAEIDARMSTCQVERAQLQTEEEELGTEVSEIVRDLEAAEVERYSGKRFDRDEAKAHDDSQLRLRERKESIEERELELLEALEDVEGRIEAEQTQRVANRDESESATESIKKVEAEVAAELERLAESRLALVPSIPENILVAYDRVRSQPRAGGRATAALASGNCGACGIMLPSHEHTKMLSEPEDALIQCPQCRRILVR